MFAWIGQAVTLRLGVSCVYLASPADAAPLCRCPGVSSRAMRSARQVMGRRWCCASQLCYRLNAHARAGRRASGHSPPGPARMLTLLASSNRRRTSP
jgi:hypothetical protein